MTEQTYTSRAPTAPAYNLSSLGAVLCVPTYGPVDPLCARSVRLAVMFAANKGLKWHGDVSPDRLGYGAARNTSVQFTLTEQPEADGIMWVDSDIKTPLWGIARLLDTVIGGNMDFASGVYHQRSPLHNPIFYHYNEDLKLFQPADALCEDLTQETFLRAFRFIKSFRTKEKLSTWLFSIAKNLCIDELRRMQKGVTVPIDAVDPDALVSKEASGGNPVSASIQIQEGEILRRAIGRLPEKYRACIVLFYFNELSYEEISFVMELSLSNTKILLFRGKKMLSELYREETRRKL